MIPFEEKRSLRVPTGIKGMDELIEGGFYKGDAILICGEAGSGKTPSAPNLSITVLIFMEIRLYTFALRRESTDLYAT